MQGSAPSPAPPPGERYLGLRYVLWLLSPASFFIVRWSGEILPGPLRVVLGFLCVILLPGWLLQRLIMPVSRVGVAARATRSFLLGVALISFLGMAAWCFGGDTALGPVSALAARPPLLGRLSTVVWALPIFVFLGGLVHLVLRPVRRKRRVR